MSPINGLSMEVAIVGAGLSGLYTAYRLVTPDSGRPATFSPSDVQVFEMSNRIGGRLESVELPGMSVNGELGGMRYLTSQAIVTTLIEQVFGNAITHIPFPMGDDAHRFFYLRKQRFLANAWSQAQASGQQLQTRYALNDGDVGLNSDQLFNKIIYDVLTADPWFTSNYAGKVSFDGTFNYTFSLTSSDWDGVKPNLTYCFPGPYLGRKVNDIGFWNLVKDRASQEGYQFLADAGGYYSNTINWNAAEAFPYMVGDFSNAGTEYRTIDGGYDYIAYVLAGSYLGLATAVNGEEATDPPSLRDRVSAGSQGVAGGQIWMGQRLVTFRRSNGQFRYELDFQDTATGEVGTVTANHIVLAMPRRSLELLDQDSFFFANTSDNPSAATIQANIASVIPEPSFKVLMGFESPWWAEFGAMSGESVTDLPMRQCYYFGVDPTNSHSMLLGSYNDMDTVSFWKALSDDPNLFIPKPTALASAEALAPLRRVQASAVMVAELLTQLRELHGPDVTVPDPYVTWFRDWSDDPYGGGYHAWKAGLDVASVMSFMRQPMPGENIHVCGEAYSDQQGWIEGAFCVAERMLQQHFDMAWPSWLDPNYYLGW